MRRMEHEAARMGRLVDDMLLLARLDEGRPLDLVPLDLGFIAEDAVRDACAVEPDRPISLEVEPGVEVLGDADRLGQVVANLLANARAHTPAGTPVEVRVSRTRPPRCSRSLTTDLASLRRLRRTCSSDSCVPIRHGRERRAEPGSGWRSSRPLRTHMEGGQRCRRCPVKVRRSAWCCPLR